jgi:hypothetical protein
LTVLLLSTQSYAFIRSSSLISRSLKTNKVSVEVFPTEISITSFLIIAYFQLVNNYGTLKLAGPATTDDGKRKGPKKKNSADVIQVTYIILFKFEFLCNSKFLK